MKKWKNEKMKKWMSEWKNEIWILIFTFSSSSSYSILLAYILNFFIISFNSGESFDFAVNPIKLSPGNNFKYLLK